MNFECTIHEVPPSNCMAEGTRPICPACDRARTFIRANIDRSVVDFLPLWEQHKDADGEEEVLANTVLLAAAVDLISLFQRNAHALDWSPKELETLDAFRPHSRTPNGQSTVPLFASMLCRRWRTKSVKISARPKPPDPEPGRYSLLPSPKKSH